MIDKHIQSPSSVIIDEMKTSETEKRIFPFRVARHENICCGGGKSAASGTIGRSVN